MSDAPANAVTDLPGLPVLHLFYGVTPHAEAGQIELAAQECEAAGSQVIAASLLGHKADIGIMALNENFAPLRTLQSALARAGLELRSSYVSLTELSEYASGVPEAMKLARLRPTLPPEGLPAFCFYPMSKRRLGSDNWYSLEYHARETLMLSHGATGREFRGRVLQLVTGSTGLDDFEWGVTLFGRSLEDIKECVYTMRFDEASARFAEFGPFFVGSVDSRDEVLAAAGVRS